MEQLKEPVYILADSFFTDAYQQIKGVERWLPIEHNGTRYRVYNLYLWFFLKTKKVALHTDFHGPNKIIDGTSFVKSYAEGVEAGEKAFKERFPADPNRLYGENADVIVNEMHKALCHEPNDVFGGNGWIASVNGQQPRDITQGTVGWYGYFGGLLTSYDITESKSELLFKKWIKCEHNLTPAPVSTIPKSNNGNGKGQGSRGPYNKKARKDAVAYFTTLVEGYVDEAIRGRKKLDEEKIIEKAYKALKDKKDSGGSSMYAERTLGDYLPAPERKELFGEIRARLSRQLQRYMK